MSKFKKNSFGIDSNTNSNSAPVLSKKKNVNEGMLANGEKLSKSDKIFASIGTLEELIAFIGLVKFQNCNLQQSSTLFLFARLTQIQEIILCIINALSTSKKNNEQFERSRFSKISEKNINELQVEINKILEKSDSRSAEKKDYLAILPGESLFQSQLLYTRTLVRRAERQILASKNPALGLVPEEEIIKYLNLLGDYFLFVANSKIN